MVDLATKVRMKRLFQTYTKFNTVIGGSLPVNFNGDLDSITITDDMVEGYISDLLKAKRCAETASSIQNNIFVLQRDQCNNDIDFKEFYNKSLNLVLGNIEIHWTDENIGNFNLGLCTCEIKDGVIVFTLKIEYTNLACLTRYMQYTTTYTPELIRTMFAKLSLANEFAEKNQEKSNSVVICDKSILQNSLLMERWAWFFFGVNNLRKVSRWKYEFEKGQCTCSFKAKEGSLFFEQQPAVSLKSCVSYLQTMHVRLSNLEAKLTCQQLLE